MVPVRLGDRIAKPLVCRFMRNGVLDVAPFSKVLFRIENRGRVLHAKEASGTLDVRELGIWKRRDSSLIELHHLYRTREVWRRLAGVARKQPRRDINTAHVCRTWLAQAANLHNTCTDHHVVGGDGLLHSPVPETASPLADLPIVSSGNKLAVGHHLPCFWSVDVEGNGCLVCGVVNRGKPKARSIRPVVSKNRSMPVDVVTDDQAIIRRPSVLNSNAQIRPRGDKRRYGNQKLADFVPERNYSSIHPYSGHGQAGEVECQRVPPLSLNREPDLRVPGDHLTVAR